MEASRSRANIVTSAPMKTASTFARRVSCAIAALALASVPRAAHAFEFGAGLIGIAGGNFQDKPNQRPAGIPDLNPGFGGPTIGGGLMLDARFIPWLGLEFDVIRSGDHGTGTYNQTKITIGQGAWHLPILAKVTIDLPVVAPAFFVGPEIVLPSKSNVTLDPVPLPGGPVVTETSDTYVMVTFGLGVEIKLPLPVIDLRIPIGLRGSFSPGVSSTFNDRTTINLLPPGVTYHSEWRFQAAATLGAAVYF
jgi:hypothetical protein